MALDWFVAPPSLTLGPIRLGAAYQPYYGGASFSNDQRESAGRLVVFPAFIWKQRGLHASAQRAFTHDRLTFAPAPVQVWKSIFPDLLPRPWRPQGLLVQPLLVNLPAAPTQWAPKFPDLIAKPAWRRPNQLSPELFPTTVVTFGWKVTYPDLIARVRIRPDALTQSVIGLQAIGTTKIEWRPTYPDLHWRTGLAVGLQRPLIQNVDPIVNPPAPELSWGPSYQDWIARPARTAWFQPSVADPRIMPPSPELAWRVTAPDWVARQTMSVASMPSLFFQQRVIQPDIRMDWQIAASEPMRRSARITGGDVRPTEVPVSPVVWVFDRSDPPDAPTRRPFLITGGATAPPMLVVIGSNLGWQNDAPSLVLRRPSPLTEALTVRVTQPLVPGGFVPGASAWCVMFSDDAILSPALAPEMLKLPALADDTVRTPMFHSEQVC